MLYTIKELNSVSERLHKAIAFLMAVAGVALVMLSTVRYGIAGLVCSTLGLFSFVALMIELDKGLGSVLKRQERTFSFQLMDGKALFSFLIRKSLGKEKKKRLKKRLYSLCSESVDLLEKWEDLSFLYEGIRIVEVAQTHRIKFEADFLRQLKELLEVAEDATYGGYTKDQLEKMAGSYNKYLTERLDEMARTVRNFKDHFLLLSFKLEMEEK